MGSGTTFQPTQVSAAAVSWSAENVEDSATPTEYLLGGGAMHYVSNRLEQFSDYTLLPSPIKLNSAAHGDNTFIVGQGFLIIPATDGTDVWMNNVYYLPQATENNISQESLLEGGARL